MNADKLVRLTGYLAVVAVAAVAALISYWHAVSVVGKHGETGYLGHLYPATIDGLIMAASMVLLDAARNNEKPHGLAWWLVGAGIVATLTANVLDGVSSGVLGAIIAAWPAAALVGAYEMIMVLIRNAAVRRDAARAKADKEAQIRANIEHWASMPMPKIPQPEEAAQNGHVDDEELSRVQPFEVPVTDPTPTEAMPVQPGRIQIPDGYQPTPRKWEDDATWFQKDPTFTPTDGEPDTVVGRLDRKVPYNQRVVTGTIPAVKG